MEISAAKAIGTENQNVIPMPRVVAGTAVDTPEIAPDKKEALNQDQVAEKPEAKEVMEVLESFQDLSETLRTKLNFSVHEEGNEIVVKVIDKETDQLIRQIPSEEMLELQDKMEDLAGFLFSQNV